MIPRYDEGGTAMRALRNQSTVTSSRWASKSPTRPGCPARTAASALVGIDGSESVSLAEDRVEDCQVVGGLEEEEEEGR